MENFGVLNTSKNELLWAIIIQKYLDNKGTAERPPLGAPQGSYSNNVVMISSKLNITLRFLEILDRSSEPHTQGIL